MKETPISRLPGMGLYTGMGERHLPLCANTNVGFHSDVEIYGENGRGVRLAVVENNSAGAASMLGDDDCDYDELVTGERDCCHALARLFAASPEMYEALESLTDALKGMPDFHRRNGDRVLADITERELTKARTALSRARGAQDGGDTEGAGVSGNG